MAETSARPTITVSEARESDIDSLTTILPRSFHPVNPYIKRTLPDTPNVRAWWRRAFEDSRQNPSCHVLVARDPSTDKDIGILLLRLFAADERGVGLWTSYACADDMVRESYQAMIDSMVEWREKLMMGRPHYLIELFGADDAWKGKGVGMALLSRACEIADGEGHDVFVQANGNARGFYERLGFGCEAQVDMPGDTKYTECMMVRRHHG